MSDTTLTKADRADDPMQSGGDDTAGFFTPVPIPSAQPAPLRLFALTPPPALALPALTGAVTKDLGR